MTIRLFPACLFLALLGVASPFRSEAREAPKVELRFVSFPKSLKPVKLEMLIGEGKTVMIEAPSNEISAPMRIPAQPAWVFGEKTVDADGKPTFHVLGKGKSLSSPSQILLLVRKRAKDSDAFDVITLDGRTSGFGGGKMLFMNAARVKLGFDLGGKKFTLEPGAHRIIAPESESGLCQAILYYDRNGEARPFFSSKWPVNDKARAMIFIYHDPSSKKLRLHSLREFLE